MERDRGSEQPSGRTSFDPDENLGSPCFGRGALAAGPGCLDHLEATQTPVTPPATAPIGMPKMIPP